MAPQTKQEARCFCHVNCIQTHVLSHHLCNITLGLFMGDQSWFFMISSLFLIREALVLIHCSLWDLLPGFPPCSEPSCSSSYSSRRGLLHPDLPRSAAFNCVWNKTCFHLRAPHFQLFFLLFVFSGSNNFVPFLILCNNYGSAMLQIFSSPRLYFVFFARLSLIIHRQRMENFTAICSCWMNPSYCFVSHRQNSSDGSFVVLNVIWLLLWQATYQGGEGGGSRPVKRIVLVCCSKSPPLAVRNTLRCCLFIFMPHNFRCFIPFVCFRPGGCWIIQEVEATEATGKTFGRSLSKCTTRDALKKARRRPRRPRSCSCSGGIKIKPVTLRRNYFWQQK